MSRGPYLPNIEPIIAAGIDPKTGLPMKATSGIKAFLKDEIKKQLRVKDEAEFVNRYTWYNLPCNLTSAELERLLYYKYQLCLFYDPNLENFYFMPFALDGTIDYYGRFNTIHPVPMTSGGEEKENSTKMMAAYLETVKLNVKYGIEADDMDPMDIVGSTCILRDYTPQLSPTAIPRQILTDPLLDVMAETIPLMRTRLILGTGVKGVRVNDSDQAESVKDGSRSLEKAALSGEGYIPIVGNLEFQELSDNSAGKSEEYMLAYQSLDNYRKETMGLPSNGTFNKKAHMLASEQAMNSGNVELVLQDGLRNRQAFCNIANSIWGLGIWCEISEDITNMDANGDGAVYDRDEGESTGTEARSSDDTDL